MENKELSACPNCGQPLKSGMLSSNKIIEQIRIDIINEYHDKKSDSYCDKCGKGLYNTYKDKLIAERAELSKGLSSLISYIPLASIHSPVNWNYDVLGLVTGQTTTGTGAFSEISSSFTDLFGSQSKSYNRKIKGGEELCMGQIRKQTIDMGGNAIVGIDIDYSEVGGAKGMLMVCMTGTAIRLRNPEVLGGNNLAKINELVRLNERMMQLNKYVIPAYES